MVETITKSYEQHQERITPNNYDMLFIALLSELVISVNGTLLLILTALTDLQVKLADWLESLLQTSYEQL